MENKYLICCPHCSGKLTKSWDDGPSYMPSKEFQTCEEHGIVSTYSWGIVRTPVDVRKPEVIKKFPRQYKLSYEQIKYLVRIDLEKIIKEEPQCLEWNDERLYIKLSSYYKADKKYKKYKKYMDSGFALKYFNIDIKQKNFLQLLFS